ncbi:ras guanine nucleotide exchange factor P-like [Bicyclus anynana]|uniref:Ras guanine nucleotide exchange factor P-like n=1 Tax=Bicyclus anynana TaxID=110368 RepID=A0ABM3LV39_BICAN|nr:ras guanine nucleotide exchange factor P-like [Bicyclus anynana]
MNKCEKCGKNITKRNPGLECAKCEKIVHGNTVCSGLTNKQLAAVRAADNLEWTCTECHNTSIRRSSFIIPEEDDEEASPSHRHRIDGSQDVCINVKQLLNDMSKEMEKAIQKEMKECMRSLQYHSEKMDEMIESMEFCKQSIQDLKRKNCELTNKNTNLETRVIALEQRLQETEQQKLGDQIEILNLHDCEEKDTKGVVDSIAKKLCLPYEDIINVNFKLPRARKDRGKMPGSILLKMKSENIQQKWIATSKTIKVTVKDIISNANEKSAQETVFLREALTPYNKNLLWNAKNQLKDTYKFIWFAILAICILEVSPQETATPASFLEPRNFNYHPYELRQYLEESKPTKQGPVLFPNDGPPAPRTPLIVTTRPLLEAIANSDLNPNPRNSSTTQNTPSQNIPLNPAYPLPSPDVTVSPDLLADISPISNNALFDNNGGNAINNVPEASSYTQVPYAAMLLKARLGGYSQQNRFNDYEEQTVLPPIYRALSDHARQNVLKQREQKQYNYQRHNAGHDNQYGGSGATGDNGDYDQDPNYAFSYRVNDHKTGDDFSHKQQSVSGGTNGEYRVRLPDGRTQIVSYTADETGYKADVRYDDENNAKIKNTNTDNDYNNMRQNDDNIRTNYFNQNNNKLITLNNNNNGFVNIRNNDYNNIRQYENQNIANYFTPQNYNIRDYEDRITYNPQNYNIREEDRINYNTYVNHDNTNQYDTTNQRNDYVNYKDVTPIKEDPNQYNSKEYYDYSDYNQNYDPYVSKFAVFKPISTPNPIITTVRPTFAYKPVYTVAPTQGIQYADGVISATNNPVVKYETTTENVVLIGGKKVYTNVNQVLPTKSTSTVKNVVSVTPASYLASTIASLRDRITSTPRPIILGNLINRINKYLTYK